MSREYSVVLGSGQTPMLAVAPPYEFPDGTFPVPNQRDSLRTRTGQGVVVLNPEDFSVSIGIKNTQVTVGNLQTKLVSSPFEFRRAIAISNLGPDILYIGTSTVNTLNGFPLLINEKIAISAQDNPNIIIWGISAGTSDVRILEGA